MRVTKFLRFLLAVSLTALFCVGAVGQSADKGAKLLPDRIGNLRAEGKVIKERPAVSPDDYGVMASFARRYGPYQAVVTETTSNAAAYSLLTRGVMNEGHAPVGPNKIDLGGAEAVSIVYPDAVAFIKGSTFVEVGTTSKLLYPEGKEWPVSDDIKTLARAIANSIEAESGELPALALHLPEWEKVRGHAVYAVSLPALEKQLGENEPVLDALSFEGGAEAVAANYGDARLVIVEFTTPQYAFDADAAINKRIAELKAAGQPVPSSYKRVGNYSVFVFDAPDSASADKLISGVKYEKDVRWLGRNPHAEEIATRAYTSTMGGVILTTLITTGLAILLCLTVGGAIGGAIFLSRRAKHAAQEIYSDAGGMLRLNIEDVNTPHTTKMLGRGED